MQKLRIEAEARAVEVIKNNRKTLDNLAEALIKEEVLERDDVERIIKESK